MLKPTNEYIRKHEEKYGEIRHKCLLPNENITIEFRLFGAQQEYSH